MPIRRLILLRHGETDGPSSLRYFGGTDIPLSAAGRAQMRRAALELRFVPIDLFLASTLRRSWESASIVSWGRPVRIEHDLREIHFGRWEGLTREEIQARDPDLFEQWQQAPEEFDYPNGEPRARFRERVHRAIDAALSAPGHTALAVLHKGVIREIVLHLTGQRLESGHPPLGERVVLTRRLDGPWRLGQRSSDPPGLHEKAA